MGPYLPTSLANSFLELGFDADVPVDPMKIQKLLFFSHGYYLSLTGSPLTKEPFQAWRLGPVIPSLYHRLKQFGGSPITEYAQIYDAERADFRRVPVPRKDKGYDFVRDFVWESYGKDDSLDLSRLTHRKGWAWKRTIDANPEILGPQIPDKEILKDFKDLISDEERQEFA